MRGRTVVSGAVLAGAVAVSAFAYHSFAVIFDVNKKITLKGHIRLRMGQIHHYLWGFCRRGRQDCEMEIGNSTTKVDAAGGIEAGKIR